MSRSRIPKGPASANLYCATCETIIGTFKNEWRHVTTSYALPTLPGEHHEPVIEERTRIVPDGVSSKAAAGCEMANVLCSSCSTTVGQYCVKVDRRDQKYLLKSYLYKLTKVYLMEHATTKKKGFYFIDEEPAKENTRSSAEDSEAVFAPNGLRIPTIWRATSGPAVSCSSQNVTEGAGDSVMTPQDLQQPIETLVILSRQMYEHGSAINDNFDRIATTNGRIATESARIDVLESTTAKLEDQQSSVESIKAEMKLNLTRYLLHDKAITELLAIVEAQRKDIKMLSAELYNIRNQLKQKEVKEPPPVPQPRRGPLSGLSPSSTKRVAQDMQRQKEQESDREERPVLGKRKRIGSDRSASRKSLRRVNTHDAASMLTPEPTQDPRLDSSPSVADERERIEGNEIVPDKALDRVDSMFNQGTFNPHNEGSDTISNNGRRHPARLQVPIMASRTSVKADKRSTEVRIEDSPTREAVAPVRFKDSNGEVPGHLSIMPARSTRTIDSPADAIDFSSDEDTTAIDSSTQMPVTVAKVAETSQKRGKDLAKSCQAKESGSQDREDRCLPCGRSGKVLCCQNCSKCYHLGCLKAPVKTLSSTNWICPDCVNTDAGSRDMSRTKEAGSSNATLNTRLRLAQKEMLRSEPSAALQTAS